MVNLKLSSSTFHFSSKAWSTGNLSLAKSKDNFVCAWRLTGPGAWTSLVFLQTALWPFECCGIGPSWTSLGQTLGVCIIERALETLSKERKWHFDDISARSAFAFLSIWPSLGTFTSWGLAVKSVAAEALWYLPADNKTVSLPDEASSCAF